MRCTDVVQGGGGGGDDGETKAVGYRLSKQQNVRE